MTNLKSFLSSTIGKKVLVAITGILFCLFLLFHLVNNLVIYTGEENFNYLVSSLEKIKPLIRLLEVVLLTILVVHISNSVYCQFNLENLETKQAYLTLKNQMRHFHLELCCLLEVYCLFLLWFTYQHFGSIFS